MDIISVIVPIYNIEKYIRRCVESIMQQTFKRLQIILVDDGSTDDSGRICDELAAQDKRIEVVHQKNGGLSEARNTGLSKAIGTYIGFIDGDDYIDTEMYQILYDAMQDREIDIASCGYYEQYDDRNNVMCCSKNTVVLDKILAYKALFAHEAILGCSSVNKLFKKELFDNINYKKGIQGEDLELIYRILHKVQKLVCINAVKYHYVHREGSITASSFNCKELDIIQTTEEMVRFIEITYPEVSRQAYAYQLMWIISSMKSLYLSKNQKLLKYEKKLIYHKIYKNFKHYWCNPNIYVGTYILFWAAVLHLFKPVQWLLDKIVIIYHKLKGGIQ